MSETNNFNARRLEMRKERLSLFVDNNGDEYGGEWANQQLNGYGRSIFYDGSQYEGQFKDHKFNGWGRHLTIYGKMYEGGWKNGLRNGYGIEILPHKTQYYGYWENNLKHGKGTQISEINSKYEGEYSLGKKEGFGKQICDDQTTYNGYWKENSRNGFGIQTWSDGTTYEGYWVDNRVQGRGIFKYSDGNSYEGELLDDQQAYHGYGIFTYSDEEGIIIKNIKVFEAYWVHCALSDKVSHTLEGTTTVELWEHDQLISLLEDEQELVLKPSNWDEFQFPQLDEEQEEALIATLFLLILIYNILCHIRTQSTICQESHIQLIFQMGILSFRSFIYEIQQQKMFQ